MLGAILGAVGGVASSLLSKSSADKANAAARENALRQEQLQRDFAQQGIQWKVEDAKKAGIHPLYALGANTVAYSPVSVGQSSTDFSGLAQAGQNIGRAIDGTRTDGQRAEALQTTLLAAQTEGVRIDNEIKRAELQSKLATNATRGPAMAPAAGTTPSEYDGQGDAIKLSVPGIKLETRRDVSAPGSPEYVAGSGPGVGLYKNTSGGYSPVIPPELAESFDPDLMGSIDWNIRNRILPNFGIGKKPNIPRGEGQYVEWNPFKQQWELKTIGYRGVRETPPEWRWTKTR